jgi:hypothetical protein
MKLFFFIIVILFSLTACENHDEQKKYLSKLAKDTATFTNIQWIDSLQDIGVVEAGKKTEIRFRFKNVGQKPLLIISAEPGCGCTIADYPKEPIAPAAEGIITAAYNVNAGTSGEFRKNIHVTTNTKGTQSHYIYFYGKIKNDKDSTITLKNIDTAELRQHISYELKRNLLLKSTKN